MKGLHYVIPWAIHMMTTSLEILINLGYYFEEETSWVRFMKIFLITGELYDYDNDPLETENYYNNKEYVSVKKELLDYFAEYAKQQNEELKTSKANRVYTKNL